VHGQQWAALAIWANNGRLRSCPQATEARELRSEVRRVVRSGDSHRKNEKPAPNVRAEAPREAGRLWPAADNELASTRLPAKGGLPRGVASRARG